MPIREEEYAILAFAMESIVSEMLTRHPMLGPPRVYLVDSEADLGAGKEDLVHSHPIGSVGASGSPDFALI